MPLRPLPLPNSAKASTYCREQQRDARLPLDLRLRRRRRERSFAPAPRLQARRRSISRYLGLRASTPLHALSLIATILCQLELQYYGAISIQLVDR
jgi:hypothetical protein